MRTDGVVTGVDPESSEAYDAPSTRQLSHSHIGRARREVLCGPANVSVRAIDGEYRLRYSFRDGWYPGEESSCGGHLVTDEVSMFVGDAQTLLLVATVVLGFFLFLRWAGRGEL